MRLTYPIYRLRQLLPTARRVYRQEGGLVLLNRLGRWLMGERGQASRTPPDQGDAWTAWCKDRITPDRDSLVYVCKTRFIVCLLRGHSSTPLDRSMDDWMTTSSLSGVIGDWVRESYMPYLNTDILKAVENKPDWILFIRKGDMLLQQAKRYIDQAVRDHPNADVIYGDYITADGADLRPHFRPGLVGPLLWAENMLEPLAIVRRTAFEELGGFAKDRPFWFWDLALRLQQRGGEWVRINHALVQTQQHEVARNTPVLQEVLREALNERGLKNVSITIDVLPNKVLKPSLTWALPDKHRVSIIIPNRDQPALLRQCLNSVLYRTIYDDFEVIVVDTGSTDPQTEAIYTWFADEPRFRLIRHAETPFNFSRVCNIGAQQATGDLILFLNNDTQILNPDWLQRMAQWFALPKTGIVGARLVYPDGTLQHAGVTVGLWGLAGHTRTGMSVDHDSVLGSDAWPRQMLAVTGACLMISRVVFDEVGGWDEGYQLNFSDVQLCLDAHTRGYQVIYAPEATVMHHEGQTHQRAVPRADFVRASETFAPWLVSGDPSYHPALSYRTPHLAPNEDGHLPAMLNYEVMRRLPPDAWIQV